MATAAESRVFEVYCEALYDAHFKVSITPYGIKAGWTPENLLEALDQDGEGTAREKLDNDFIWLTNERFQKINDKDGHTVAIFELTYEAIESPSLELAKKK